MTNIEIVQKLATLETKLCLGIKHLREQMDSRFMANDKALTIATDELARRLDLLNGESDRLRNMQETYVPKNEWNIKYDALIQKVSELKEYKDISVGKHLMLSAVVAIAVSLIVAYFN